MSLFSFLRGFFPSAPASEPEIRIVRCRRPQIAIAAAQRGATAQWGTAGSQIALYCVKGSKTRFIGEHGARGLVTSRSPEMDEAQARAWYLDMVDLADFHRSAEGRT